MAIGEAATNPVFNITSYSIFRIQYRVFNISYAISRTVFNVSYSIYYRIHNLEIVQSGGLALMAFCRVRTPRKARRACLSQNEHKRWKDWMV